MQFRRRRHGWYACKTWRCDMRGEARVALCVMAAGSPSRLASTSTARRGWSAFGDHDRIRAGASFRIRAVSGWLEIYIVMARFVRAMTIPVTVELL
jgi:hypothetical protein